LKLIASFLCYLLHLIVDFVLDCATRQHKAMEVAPVDVEGQEVAVDAEPQLSGDREEAVMTGIGLKQLSA
jgi:hypothetical protein